MKKENFLIPTVVITFFSIWLTFNNSAMGALRQDADAALELTTIRKNLSVYSKMKPEDARGFYEEALNELQVMTDMFAGTEEALEATFYIGATYNILGNFDEAIAYFDDVLSFQNEIDENFKARRLGKLAPDFHTTDLDGNPLSLSKLEGKIIVMNFWATWNDQCLEKISEIKQLYRKLKGPDVQFIGISRDDEIDDLKGVVLQKNIEWPQIFEGMRYKGSRVQYIGNSKDKITQIVTTLIVRGEKKSGY